MWEFDEKRRSEALFHYTIRPPFHGHLFQAFMIHAHHDWIDDLRVYCATPRELGLSEFDPESFARRSESLPLYLRDKHGHRLSFGQNNRANLSAETSFPRLEEALAESRRKWSEGRLRAGAANETSGDDGDTWSCERELAWSLAPRSERTGTSSGGGGGGGAVKVWRKTMPTFHGPHQQQLVPFGPSSVFTIVSLASPPQLRDSSQKKSSAELSSSGILAPQHSLVYFWYLVKKEDESANRELTKRWAMQHKAKNGTKLRITKEEYQLVSENSHSRPVPFKIWSNGVDDKLLSQAFVSMQNEPERCNWNETKYGTKKKFLHKHPFCSVMG